MESNYAIIEMGGKQYRVEENAAVDVERLAAAIGDEIEADRVLLLARRGKVKVGTPFVKGAHVTCRVMAHDRGRKINMLTYKAKKNERRRKGHRQSFTRLRVEKIRSR
jgi:large subunit ribosomal protein L21